MIRFETPFTNIPDGPRAFAEFLMQTFLQTGTLALLGAIIGSLYTCAAHQIDKKMQKRIGAWQQSRAPQNKV